MAGPRLGRKPFWQSDVAKALAATLVVAAVAAIGGFKSLDGTADNDSLLRLVEVRDLIAGQGWFDLHQYRMGLDGGFLMHWSRLVDAPIAAIILVVTAVTGSQAAGETAALIAWPFLLYALALYLLLRIGRLVAGEEAMFPLTFIGGTTLYYTGIFAPGAIDHHNIQLVLMLAMVMFLLQAGRDDGIGPALGLVRRHLGRADAGDRHGDRALCRRRRPLRRRLVPCPGRRGKPRGGRFRLRPLRRRRALSSSRLSPPPNGAPPIATPIRSRNSRSAALAGAGLAVVASTRALNGSFARRAVSLAVLGCAVAALALIYFPQCLSDPYANLDRRCCRAIGSAPSAKRSRSGASSPMTRRPPQATMRPCLSRSPCWHCISARMDCGARTC